MTSVLLTFSKCRTTWVAGTRRKGAASWPTKPAQSPRTTFATAPFEPADTAAPATAKAATVAPMPCFVMLTVASCTATPRPAKARYHRQRFSVKRLGSAAGGESQRGRALSDVEAEVHDIPVLHHVGLALEAHLAGFLAAVLAA